MSEEKMEPLPSSSVNKTSIENVNNEKEEECTLSAELSEHDYKCTQRKESDMGRDVQESDVGSNTQESDIESDSQESNIESDVQESDMESDSRESDGESDMENDIQGRKIQKNKSNLMTKKSTVQNTVQNIRFDNRNFLWVRLGHLKVKALYDAGATISLINAKVAEKFQDRLIPRETAVEGAFGAKENTVGVLRVYLEIDGVSNFLNIEAVNNINHQMILGIDFMRKWDIETKARLTQWRVGKTLLRDGKWHHFNEGENETVTICAEFTGIFGITESIREKLNRSLDEFFRIPNNPEGLQLKVQHKIILKPDSKPLRQKYYDIVSMKFDNFVPEEVRKLLADDVIEPSVSEWRSTPVLAKKETEETYLRVDYRELNQCTEKDDYPMETTDRVFDKLRKAKYVSKINLEKALWQIKLAPESRKYTAFSINESNVWQFKRITFGLHNLSKTFERASNEILTLELKPYVTRYMEHFIITTETFREHVTSIKKLIKRLKEVGIAISKDECQFFCTSLEYLGYILDNYGLRLDPEQTASIRIMPSPENVKELRRALRCLDWYSRFLKNEERFRARLVRLLKRDQPWEWGIKEEEAYDNLKRALIEAPILARPDFNKTFKIQSNTSDITNGAVLIQEHEDGEHPVFYTSEKLSTIECKHGRIEREMLALFSAIRKFRPYVEGCHFIVESSEYALQYLQTYDEPHGILAHWMLELQHYDFEIRYIHDLIVELDIFTPSDSSEESSYSEEDTSYSEEMNEENQRQRERSPCFDEQGRRRRGNQFGGLKLIHPDPELDPAPGKCYVCWGLGHAHKNCPNKYRHPGLKYCYNCGRRHRTLWNCERCKDAHNEHRAKKGMPDRRFEPPRPTPQVKVKVEKRVRSNLSPTRDIQPCKRLARSTKEDIALPKIANNQNRPIEQQQMCAASVGSSQNAFTSQLSLPPLPLPSLPLPPLPLPPLPLPSSLPLPPLPFPTLPYPPWQPQALQQTVQQQMQPLRETSSPNFDLVLALARSANMPTAPQELRLLLLKEVVKELQKM